MVSCGETIVTRKISLGPNETRLLFELEKAGRTIFTFNDAVRTLGSSKTAAKLVISRLKAKGRIVAAQKARYVLAPARSGIEGQWSEHPFLIVPHIIDEYYVGFWTAMNHWGMTEQIPITVFVATTKRKRTVKYGGQTIRFVTLSKRKFFGFTQEKIDGQSFNISTREKTITDGLVFSRHCGGMSEVTKAIWNSRQTLDWNKLLAMTKQVAVDAALRRLGYILHLLRIRPEVVRSLAKQEWHGLRFLEPTGPKKALSYSKEFGLILNVSDSKLTSWRET
jgi:predicted transcriptional regulator of viral defense system